VTRNSSGGTRTLDLSIMSRTLLPSELRCRMDTKNSRDLVPAVVPKDSDEQTVVQINNLRKGHRHYEECEPLEGTFTSPLLRANTEAPSNTLKCTDHSARRSASTFSHVARLVSGIAGASSVSWT
jgi:hypothetical protein